MARGGKAPHKANKNKCAVTNTETLLSPSRCVVAFESKFY